MEPLTPVVDVAAADSVDVAELADVAAQTFPLACPPTATHRNIASFVAANLSADRFAEYLNDPNRAIITALQDDRIVGYAMIIRDTADSTAELSKMYVLAHHHGAGVAATLMQRALEVARDWGVRHVWLGVNQKNERAQRFYTKSGFQVNGTRTFQLGADTEDDYLMIREVG
ncbi:GNAT family acetyltransferase [Mycobacterium sp. 1100029.7]|nr:GNAT family acetyltransferase [Mycobacterium sp. 1100029.7]